MAMLDNLTEEMVGMALGSANTTSNTSLFDSTNNITLLPYYAHAWYVATSYIFAYLLIFLLCVVGNILVCLIVLGSRRMRTVTNIFILNLAVSDLLVGIFCIPTTLVDNLITGWPFSNSVCKLSGFVQGASVSASVFTLVAIAVERFRCIVYPLQPKATIRVAKAAIVLIWVLAMAIMCPAAVALTVEEVSFHNMVCDDDFNHTMPLYICYEKFGNPKMRKVYTVVLFAHIYLAPLMVIIVTYGCIGAKLSSSGVANRRPQGANVQRVISQKKKQAIKMLILVTLLFMLSWLPLWTLMMMADYAGLESDQIDLLTSYIFPFAHWLAFANSSINPVIYSYYNDNFKRGFQVVSSTFSLTFSCLVPWNLWRRIAGCFWKKSVQRSVEATNCRDSSDHNNRLLFGLRNRIRNDRDKAELNLDARAGRMGVRSGSEQGIEMSAMDKKKRHGEELGKVNSVSILPNQAWDN
ncbi:neuropeptide FF receptor 1 like 2 [Dunckerocampus dactyliophorus]|uniref:neuropeptide FF receptor 1 like 2 n=1 Tax=Dunckerocampus dactyliophorus TaxID=161453 RepID=UPI0024069424|nr:neuropeptide FF receptor 1 like 2 [Dunckerocampus dactyliophorus]